MTNSIKNFYNRLADFLIENLDLDISVILEVGCGQGQLTIPFIQKISKYLDNFKLIAFDLSSTPYFNSLETLKKKVKQEGLEDLIIIIPGDVRDMNSIEDESIDLIFSNELLCDLDRRGLESAFKEFYRVLIPNCQMVHAELNPIPENIPQKLFIDADRHSLRTTSPKPDWFSPLSDELAIIMHKIGFRNIIVKYFETGIQLDFESAIEALRNWTVDPKFIEKHKKNLQKYGLEYPMEHVIFCQK